MLPFCLREYTGYCEGLTKGYRNQHEFETSLRLIKMDNEVHKMGQYMEGFPPYILWMYGGTHHRL